VDVKENVKMEKKNKKYAIIILVVLLLIFSIVQLFQVDGLKEKVKSSNSGAVSTSGVTQNQQQKTATPSTIPTMVGGC
jgi:flagellar basal body-associated protein FliL